MNHPLTQYQAREGTNVMVQMSHKQTSERTGARAKSVILAHSLILDILLELHRVQPLSIRPLRIPPLSLKPHRVTPCVALPGDAPKSPMPELGWGGVLPFTWRADTPVAFEVMKPLLQSPGPSTPCFCFVTKLLVQSAASPAGRFVTALLLAFRNLPANLMSHHPQFL